MTTWLTCPKCPKFTTYRVKDGGPGAEAYEILWLHVFRAHATGTGRDRNNSAAAIMQRHRKVDS